MYDLKDDFLPYDIVDSIPDERFGNAKDFISLVENVHNRGMYIVIDLPIATTSKYHEWCDILITFSQIFYFSRFLKLNLKTTN